MRLNDTAERGNLIGKLLTQYSLDNSLDSTSKQGERKMGFGEASARNTKIHWLQMICCLW